MRARSLSVLFLVLLIGLFGPSSAQASAIIDFGTGAAGAGGTLVYGGDGGALTGSGILIQSIQGISTPAHAGNHFASGTGSCPFTIAGTTYPLTCAVLTFSTGNLDAAASAATGQYVFGSGGTFTITGGMADASVPTGSVLASGTFASNFVVDSSQMSLVALGGDTMNAQLLSYFGISAGTPFSFNSFIVGGTTAGGASVVPFNSSQSANGAAFTLRATSTDFSSIATPEPASLSLLLLGGGIAAFRRRRARKTSSAPPSVA